MAGHTKKQTSKQLKPTCHIQYSFEATVQLPNYCKHLQTPQKITKPYQKKNVGYQMLPLPLVAGSPPPKKKKKKSGRLSCMTSFPGLSGFSGISWRQSTIYSLYIIDVCQKVPLASSKIACQETQNERAYYFLCRPKIITNPQQKNILKRKLTKSLLTSKRQSKTQALAFFLNFTSPAPKSPRTYYSNILQ